jgi:hypothetical protein
MRHITTLFLLALLSASTCCAAQSSPQHEWHFGAYTVRAGECATNTALTISRGSDTLYYNCGGDGFGYTIVDTISLNNDSLPDFVYAYQMEEYTVIGMLVSRPGKKHYLDIDITYDFDPQTYDTTIAKDAVIQTLVLRDINNDGRRDMLINSLAGDNYKIPHWTITLYNSQLRDIAAGRLKIDKNGHLVRPLHGLLSPK